MSHARRSMGRLGESLAASYLEGQGYLMLERNWRCRFGEIDLIARDGDALVLVEVRARRGSKFGRPEESVDRRKQVRLARLAQAYVQQRAWQGAWRIDVVAVELSGQGPAQIRHYPSAIGL